MSGQLCRSCSDWPCICGAGASHSLLPKVPRKPAPVVLVCERCGSDRFVHTAKVNGQRICLACEDSIQPDPMTAYKQMVERVEN